MKNSKFNELQFYVIFFTIFLIVSNFVTSQMLYQEEPGTGMMPVNSVLIPALIQIALVFLVIWAAKHGGNSLKDIGFRTYSWWQDCIIGLGIFVFLFITVPRLHEFLVNVLHLSEFGLSKIPFSPLWVVSAMVIGVAEELIFRGYGYTVLNKYLKRPWIAVLIVSALFGAEHFYRGSAGAAQTFIIALIANGIFIWRKSLIPVTIAHAAMNIIMPLIT